MSFLITDPSAPTSIFKAPHQQIESPRLHPQTPRFRQSLERNQALIEKLREAPPHEPGELSPFQKSVSVVTSPKEKQAIQRLIQATVPIFQDKHPVGNGVAIAANLVLTSTNCGDAENLELQRTNENELPAEMSVIFEDRHAHFKILQSPFNLFHPIPLSGIAQSEKNAQAHFDPGNQQMKIKIESPVDNLTPLSPRLPPRNPSNPLSPRLPPRNPSNPLSPRLALRNPLNSFSPRFPLNNVFIPEQGAPQMALSNEKVYAIRHNDSTLINIFDIYASLQQAVVLKQNRTALSILSMIGNFDCNYVTIEVPFSDSPNVSQARFENQDLADFDDGILDELSDRDDDSYINKSPAAHEFEDIHDDKGEAHDETGHKFVKYGFMKMERATLKIWPQDRLYEHKNYCIIPPPPNPDIFEELAKCIGTHWCKANQPPPYLSQQISNISYVITLESSKLSVSREQTSEKKED